MGGIQRQLIAIIGGLVILVIGLVLETIVFDQAATAGANSNIGSFTGAQAFNDLVPLMFVIAIVMIGVGLMALGGAGLTGRGPLAR